MTGQPFIVFRDGGEIVGKKRSEVKAMALVIALSFT